MSVEFQLLPHLTVNLRKCLNVSNAFLHISSEAVFTPVKGEIFCFNDIQFFCNSLEVYTETQLA